MLKLQLRDEFKGERLKGTTIDFSADKTTGVLKKPAGEFLSITYPSVDLLKVLEAAQPEKPAPSSCSVVVAKANRTCWPRCTTP